MLSSRNMNLASRGPVRPVLMKWVLLHRRQIFWAKDGRRQIFWAKDGNVQACVIVVVGDFLKGIDLDLEMSRRTDVL